MPETLRATSTYRVDVPTKSPSEFLTQMILACPYEVNGSGTYDGVPYVRFRCPSDDALALAAAKEMSDGRGFDLSTGYGVNARYIHRAHPAGRNRQ